MITTDLSKECPQWVLSAYGPGKDAPKQLFGGHPREQSFEEMRSQHYALAAQGKQQEAIEEARALVSSLEAQRQSALNDIDGAIKYILDGEHEHPNRIDICNAKGQSIMPNQNVAPSSQPAPIPGQSTNNVSVFVKPSAPSTFGQPSAPIFGQPSTPAPGFGQMPARSFGQPSFGQASTLGRTPTNFGQLPSTSGQTSNPTSGFGQPTTSGPLASSQASSTSSAQPIKSFQRPSASSQTSFGQPSALPQSGIFGQPSAPSTRNPFAQTPATQNITAQSAAAQRNPFATVSPSFTSQGQNFRASQSPLPSMVSTQQNEGLNQASGGQSAPDIVSGQHLIGAQIQRDVEGKMVKWNGKMVSYINSDPCHKGRDGAWQRIWFPDGVPTFINSDGLSDSAYDNKMKENYEYLKDQGTFKNGIMPLLPPKREWCNWDL